MQTFSYRPSGKDVPRGGQGVRQGLILPSLRSARARTSCSRCQKNLSLQTAVKVLYIFSILLIVAVTVLAALGEHGQGWEVQLLPPLLPSSRQPLGDTGAPPKHLQHPGMERSIQPRPDLPPGWMWDPVHDATSPGDGFTLSRGMACSPGLDYPLEMLCRP